MYKQTQLKIFIVLSLSIVLMSFGKKKDPNDSDGTYSVAITIKNIRNKKGRIQLQIYRDQKSFAKETPWKTKYVSKKDVVNHSIVYTVSGLKPGVYGFALLDDENKDTKMDYGWIMPKEGFGFSDYYHTAWSKPKFQNFKFGLYSNKSVTMRIRYL